MQLIKKFTIMSHPSHTGLFSYLQLVAVHRSASFSGPSSFSSYKRPAVAQGLKSSLMTRKLTYFCKNCVQIRKSRMQNPLEMRLKLTLFSGPYSCSQTANRSRRSLGMRPFVSLVCILACHLCCTFFLQSRLILSTCIQGLSEEAIP